MCLKREGIAILNLEKRRLQKFCLMGTDLRNSQAVLSRIPDLSNFDQTLDFCGGRGTKDLCSLSKL